MLIRRGADYAVVVGSLFVRVPPLRLVRCYGRIAPYATESIPGTRCPRSTSQALVHPGCQKAQAGTRSSAPVVADVTIQIVSKSGPQRANARLGRRDDARPDLGF